MYNNNNNMYLGIIYYLRNSSPSIQAYCLAYRRLADDYLFVL